MDEAEVGSCDAARSTVHRQLAEEAKQQQANEHREHEAPFDHQVTSQREADLVILTSKGRQVVVVTIGGVVTTLTTNGHSEGPMDTIHNEWVDVASGNLRGGRGVGRG
jgi:hypothetical protein